MHYCYDKILHWRLQYFLFLKFSSLPLFIYRTFCPFLSWNYCVAWSYNLLSECRKWSRLSCKPLCEKYSVVLSAPLWGLIFWYKAWRRYVCERYKLLPHSVKFLYFKCREVVGYQILFMSQFSVISSNNLWYLVYHWKRQFYFQHSLFSFLMSANFKRKF